MRALPRAAAAPIALAVAYVAILGGVGAVLGTWTDEEYTLATTAHGVAYAAVRAVRYELQAPLYFVVLAAWRSLDGDVWFARLFSVACGAGSFLAFASIGRRIAPQANPLPFAALAALNPFAIRAAFEIRVYALALLLSALLWLAFDAGFVRQYGARARVAFVALAIAGTYTQYFVAFALVGYGAALLVRGKARALYAYAACCGAIAVGLVPLAFVVPGQLETLPIVAPPLPAIVRFTLVHPALDLLFPDPAGLLPHRAYLALVTLGLVALGAGVAALPRRSSLAAPALAATVLAGGVLATYVAAAAYLRVEFTEHYFVALYVPFAAAAYAVGRAISGGRRPAAAAAFALTAALSVATLAVEYRPLAQAGDWRRVAAYLSAHARPGDAIAVFEADARPALVRQYRGGVPVFAFPHAPSPSRYSVADVGLASATQARAAFAALAPYAHVWFVEVGDCDPRNPQYGCQYIPAGRDRYFRIVARAGFYGSEVEGLVARPKAAPKSPGRGTSRSRAGVPERRTKTALLTAYEST